MVRRAAQTPRQMMKAIDLWEARVNASVTAHQRLQLAMKRHAGPPAQRLAQLLKMVQDDLSTMDPAARDALGYDLRGIVAHSLNEGYTVKLGPIADRELNEYLREIRTGIQGLMSEPPTPWAFPAQPRVIVASSAKGARGSQHRRFTVQLGGKERASILSGVANLLVEAGEHLRSCPGCGTAFVVTRKQGRYCSGSCSQRARNRRRAPAAPPAAQPRRRK